MPLPRTILWSMGVVQPRLQTLLQEFDIRGSFFVTDLRSLLCAIYDFGS